MYEVQGSASDTYQIKAAIIGGGENLENMISNSCTAAYLIKIRARAVI